MTRWGMRDRDGLERANDYMGLTCGYNSVFEYALMGGLVSFENSQLKINFQSMLINPLIINCALRGGL